MYLGVGEDKAEEKDEHVMDIDGAERKRKREFMPVSVVVQVVTAGRVADRSTCTIRTPMTRTSSKPRRKLV